MPPSHLNPPAVHARSCFLALTALAGACGNDGGSQQDTAEQTSEACDEIEYDVSWTDVGRPFFKTYCTACHSVDSPERFDAPENCNFDTVEDVITWAARVQVRVLDESTMPVGGGVPEEDLELLSVYLECGL